MFSMISMQQLERCLERKQAGELDFTLLDVRSRAEFVRGHLVGAVNVPLEELERAIFGGNVDLQVYTGGEGERPEGLGDVVGRDKTIFVYCGHGSKSLLAARDLDRLGYHVLAVAGGLASYRGKYYKSI